MAIKSWIKAARLRTLPLGICGIVLGAILSNLFIGYINLPIFIFSLLTVILLQVLSNFANDYGDYVKGTDNSKRIGPERALQSGAISPSKMQGILVVMSLTTLCSGIILLYFTISKMGIQALLFFLILGILCIGAALLYTIGKKAYGYSGYGDIFVFVFFGLVAVLCSFYLQTQQLNVIVWLFAVAMGVFSVGVLNMNNMRDIENDTESNKKTIPVRLGMAKAKIYHSFLIITGLACISIAAFHGVFANAYYWFLLCFPFFVYNLISVWRTTDNGKFDRQLKILVAGNCMFVLSTLIATL